MKRMSAALLAVAVLSPFGGVSAAEPDEGRWDARIPLRPLAWTSTALLSDGVGYLATGEPHLYKTFDHGETWVPLPPPPASTSVRGVAFDSPDVGYVNAGFALYRTTDGGATWEETRAPSAASRGQVALVGRGGRDRS